MIKAIIFDCFGVLLGKGFVNTYSAAGGDPIKDNDFIKDILRKANAGVISNQDFSLNIANRLGITVDEYRKIVAEEETLNLPLFEYIKNDLKPRYKIAILSNINVGVIERKIPKELRSLFDLIILSAEVGVQKPDAIIFDITVKKLGVNYSESVFIDDLPAYINAAKKLGFRTILYDEFDTFRIQLDTLLNSK